MKLIYVFIVLVSTPFVILSRGYQSQIIKNQQAKGNARRQQILQDYKKTHDYQNNIRINVVYEIALVLKQIHHKHLVILTNKIGLQL